MTIFMLVSEQMSHTTSRYTGEILPPPPAREPSKEVLAITQSAIQSTMDSSARGPFVREESRFAGIVPPEHTAERLAVFKGDFAKSVEYLVHKNVFHPSVLPRLEITKRTPILVTGNKHQEFHYADFEGGNIFMRDISSSLYNVHEVTHFLLPGIEWKPGNEGIVQKAALMIHEHMPDRSRNSGPTHPQPEFYKAQEAIAEQFARLVGGGFRTLTRICASEDIGRNTTTLNEQVGIIDAAGKHGGLVDYAEQLELHHIKENMLKVSFSELDELVATKVVHDLKNVPSLYS